MDMEISQVNPAYYRLLLQYNRAVSQRNLLLKQMKYEASLSEPWMESPRNPFSVLRCAERSMRNCFSATSDWSCRIMWRCRRRWRLTGLLSREFLKWNGRFRKRGAHTLRHSLATTMLANNTPVPIITGVFGHVSSRTTQKYLSIDVDGLREVSLEVPE